MWATHNRLHYLIYTFWIYLHGLLFIHFVNNPICDTFCHFNTLRTH